MAIICKLYVTTFNMCDTHSFIRLVNISKCRADLQTCILGRMLKKIIRFCS